MTRFKSISNGRDRTDIVSHGKTNKFFVDELRIRDFVHVVIEMSSGLADPSIDSLRKNKDSYLEFTQPFFAIIGLLFAERKINKVPITRLRNGKWNHMFCHVTEIVSSIGV